MTHDDASIILSPAAQTKTVARMEHIPLIFPIFSPNIKNNVKHPAG